MSSGTGLSGTACRQAVPDRSLRQTALRLAREVWRMLPRKRTARLAAAREHASRIREVHNRVTHELTAMVVQADATQFLVDDNADRALAGLRAIAETGRRAIADLRDLSEAPGGPRPRLSPAQMSDALGRPAGCYHNECPEDRGRRVWGRRWISAWRGRPTRSASKTAHPHSVPGRRSAYRKPRFFT
jgi:hypothetical protein